VPAFVWWPGTTRAAQTGLSRSPVVDWLPHLRRQLAGAISPLGQKFDGANIRPLLDGSAVQVPERLLYLKYLGGMSALRDGGWKLVTRGDSRFRAVLHARTRPGTSCCQHRRGSARETRSRRHKPRYPHAHAESVNRTDREDSPQFRERKPAILVVARPGAANAHRAASGGNRQRGSEEITCVL